MEIRVQNRQRIVPYRYLESIFSVNINEILVWLCHKPCEDGVFLFIHCMLVIYNILEIMLSCFPNPSMV